MPKPSVPSLMRKPSTILGYRMSSLEKRWFIIIERHTSCMTRLKKQKELGSGSKEDVRFGTPEAVASYRAQRLAELKPDTIIEIGAGAGFQTQAFAKVAKVIAVEIDKE